MTERVLNSGSMRPLPDTEYPEQNGSIYTPQTPNGSYGLSNTTLMTDDDRKAMEENLRNKYGIARIEDDED